MSDLTIGTTTAKTGSCVRGVTPVTTLPGGRTLDILVIVINGSEPGPCVWGELA